MSLSNLAALKRRFYRLVNTASDDAGMTEWDPVGSDETLLQLLNEGMDDAHQHLVDMGAADYYLKTAALGAVRGSDPDRYVMLPADFYRLAGDDSHSALHLDNGVRWGHMIPRHDRLNRFGNRYYIIGKDPDPTLDNYVTEGDFSSGGANWDSFGVSFESNERVYFNQRLTHVIEQRIPGLEIGRTYQLQIQYGAPASTILLQDMDLFVELTDGTGDSILQFSDSDPPPEGIAANRAAAYDYQWADLPGPNAQLVGTGDNFTQTLSLVAQGQGTTNKLRLTATDALRNTSPAGVTQVIRIENVALLDESRWALGVTKGATVNNLNVDYFRRPALMMRDADPIDFPSQDREIIVAFAAVRAMEEAWYVGDPQDEQRLVRFLDRCKASVSRNARRTNEPKKVGTSPVYGERWFF